ncbi:MAG TPA: L-2-hydroxyglutarate oxidase [Solirubrobacteraceae bacterium]|nr:L-2-hydroxyglutarate oxidase [Solirubrobacteraceae bacterium]
MNGDARDLAIVGGGIIGLAAARELLIRRPQLRVTVLEREADVGRHQTGSNSGVVHAGIYYRPGSLKARLCVEGMRSMYAFCDEHNIHYERCGKVIVATDASELGPLDELEARGQANQVPGLRRIGPEELRELEPHVTGVAGLHSPQTGILDFGAVARALRDDIRGRGATVITNCNVERLTRAGHEIVLTHSDGEVRAGRAAVCAGAWSDRLAVASGAPADPRIVPFRGAYLKLRPAARGLVRSLIYPVPDPELPFLGVHLTKRIDGEVWLGPTALMVGARDAYRLTTIRPADVWDTIRWPGTWKMVAKFHRTAIDELRFAFSRKSFVAACARYVPELRVEDVEAGPAGVRAQALGRDGALVDDFVVNELDGMLFVRNAPSPAATSALSIASLIADRVEPALS